MTRLRRRWPVLVAVVAVGLAGWTARQQVGRRRAAADARAAEAAIAAADARIAQLSRYLGRMPDADFAELIDLAERSRSASQALLAVALAADTPERKVAVAAWAVRLLDHPMPRWRGQGAQALGLIKSEDHLLRLRLLATSDHPEERIPAGDAIAYIEGRAALAGTTVLDGPPTAGGR